MECTYDYFLMYSEAVGEFCAFEYRQKVIEDQWAFWDREVLQTILIWEGNLESQYSNGTPFMI